MKKPMKYKQRSATKGDVELGRKIRLRRIEMEISQAGLGDKLGVSFQQVQKYEKGVNRVGATRLEQIANALQVPVGHFYGATKQQNEVESLLFLDSGFSVRMVKAWTQIKNQAVQRHIVTLMETLATEYGEAAA
jgi:transcriptional regulator with XRE-family HTH domain